MDALADGCLQISRQLVADPVRVVDVADERLGLESSIRRAEKRYVELELASESGLSTSRQWLEGGPSAHLVAYLRKPEVVGETFTIAAELVQSTIRHRLA